jgi:outer membrane receptor protein involved in Fe transport
LTDFSELYLNWGKGFHSNDVRGATISLDPITKESVQPVDVFVDQQGAEFGWRVERGSNLLINLAYFWLESDSELLFVGDSGSTEASDASERTGLEIAVFWEFGENWVLDATGSKVNSNFVGVEKANNHIPNAHGRVLSVGITRASALGWNWSARARHFGDAALVEDDSISYPSTTLVNTGIGYEFEDWSLGLDLFNIFDAEDYDIAYWYSSKLQVESSPVEDIHFHPANPRSIRMKIEYRF